MRWGFIIQTYLTSGATFGAILAGPVWYGSFGGRALPQDWATAKPLLMTALLATGHGVLRMYIWLPSLIYYLGRHELGFAQWLFGAGW